MKREYKTPKAIRVEFEYDDNVVATSATCSGSHWVFQTPQGCAEYRFTDYPKTYSMRAAHPCDWEVEGQPFPN